MQPGALPDAEDIFDSILTRTHHNKHPNKISSMLFYLASIIIHDLFRTDHNKFSNSKTSSYLDLAPLYGSNLEEQRTMRTRKDGKIKPDCFSEVRLLSFPPGVGALLITFNRFHNTVVENLARINQSGQFKRPAGDWPDLSPEDKHYPGNWKTLDEDLFQTGRLITCGLYINIVLRDYVRTILNLNKTNSNWALDPRDDIKGLPVAAGNQVSAEFNLVYRWHAAISDRDEKWAEEFWKESFPKDDPATVDWHTFVVAASKMENTLLAMDPSERPFAKLTRENGKFKDDDLVNILADGIEDCASAFGANRVPPVMRVVEILGIEQARAWNVASLNEFRKYFGLEPHKTFESINPDPYVADQLKHLYDHPDQVELYPGLVSEEPKEPFIAGAGLTPSFTVSRAVLSDAVALVRGDRFYTVDYHPKKLTNWGFSEVAIDNSINNGCVMYKLFFNAFPNHFKSNSVYAHYPLTIPSEMESVLKTLERGKQYSYTRPTRQARVLVVSSYDAVKSILEDQDTFKVTTTDDLELLLGPAGKEVMVASSSPKYAEQNEAMEEALYVEGRWETEVREYYEMITAKLLEQKSFKIALKKNQVDIVRDIGNLAHVHFVSELFSLPLKTDERPLGVFTEYEMYLITAAVSTSVFFDVDPINSYTLRHKSQKATECLGELVQANVSEIAVGGVFSHLMAAIFPDKTPLKDYGVHLIKRLIKSGMDVKELVWGHILGTMGGLTANQGQIFAQTLDYFLNEGKEHLPAIKELAESESPVAFEKLMHYVLEGARLSGEPGVYRLVTKACELKDGDRTLKLQPGDKVLLNLPAASRDSAGFPDPDKVHIGRPLEAYLSLGDGTHQTLGEGITRVALTAMFKVIGKLDNLRPAKGPQGKLHKVAAPYPEVGEKPKGPWYHVYLTESHDRLWPFPQSKSLTVFASIFVLIADGYFSPQGQLGLAVASSVKEYGQAGNVRFRWNWGNVIAFAFLFAIGWVAIQIVSFHAEWVNHWRFPLHRAVPHSKRLVLQISVSWFAPRSQSQLAHSRPSSR
jgi:linoleate 8R-lipoxygenase / 9,12-octadecadienoate 8-hydroperoxide 8R-isomerase